ncbi:gamma-glutamylputrescine oxidase [Litoreibacter halocynthiae]|uniref:Gamma-glutamylputrescine oxidase n=1 Tax=Litoreibacter halocynthiae TaxID=1242689 RepID=A0A4V6Q397_9RHOB|nr:FAD-binding oxidoreductase [Litoreibacter halocynthiae]TDT74845.1 gamma-glutamylputrescine oxidase [Litoreibacter halocynthiae]
MNLLDANDRRGSYPDGWYAETADLLDPFAPLRGETRTDLCVIGGGYTGLSAALHAAQAGLDVVLIDAQRVGFGASGRNGGQVQSGFNKSQQALERIAGREDAHKLWEMSQEAMALTKNLCATHAAEARFTSGIAHANWHASETRDDHAEADYLAEHYGYDQIETLSRDALYDILRAPSYQGGTLDHGAGHLHPLRYALGLARACVAAGVHIFETTRAHEIKGTTVRCDYGQVNAAHVIQATNGYGTGLSRPTAARVMPINNFIAATAPLGDRVADVLRRDIAVSDSKFVVNYYRLSEDNRLLFGGGESYGYRFPKDITAVVRKPMEQVFPQFKGIEITHAWGGTLAITMSRLPHISCPQSGVLAAAGYSGHGVALAGFTGKVLADAVRGDTDGFERLAQLPTGRFPGGAALRSPLLALAMTWYATRDRLGI